MGQLGDYTRYHRIPGDIPGPPGEGKRTWDNLVTTPGTIGCLGISRDHQVRVKGHGTTS